MAGAIDWKSLEDQFSTESVYRDEISKMLQPDDTDVILLLFNQFYFSIVEFTLTVYCK